MGSDIDEIIDKLLTLFQKDFKKDFKKQEKYHLKEEANLFMKVLNYCTIIFIKQT